MCVLTTFGENLEDVLPFHKSINQGGKRVFQHDEFFKQYMAYILLFWIICKNLQVFDLVVKKL